MNAGAPGRRGGPFAFAAILVLVAAAYLPAMRGGFVFDDEAFVTPVPLRSVHGLWRIWSEAGAAKQYFPVSHSAFWIEHRLWGDSPAGYHAVNVVLHALAAWLLVRVLLALRVPGALFGGLLFALHPVCVESVAWISEQKNTLSTVFYLLAARAYLRFDARRRESPYRRRVADPNRSTSSAGGMGGAESGKRESQGGTAAAYACATALFVLAILSKSSAATLPVALLVLAWWERGRLDWRRDGIPLLPWLSIGAADGLFSAWIERAAIGARGPDFSLGWIERCLVAGRAFWFYLGKLLWPADLVFVYPRWSVDPRAAWQYAFPAALIALFVLLWRLRRRGRAPFAAASIFMLSLLPTLGFVNVYFFLYSFVADHLQYLAALAALGFIAGAWGRWAQSGGLPPRAAAAAAIGLLGLLTWRQSRNYRDAETLYRSILSRNPACWMAHNNLGGTLLHVPGHLDEAVAHIREALRLEPRSAEPHYNLGNAWSREPGQLGQAIAEYEEALRLDPTRAEARYNLGNAFSNLPGRLEDAAAQYREALRLKPDYVEARDNLGSTWAREGRLAEAADQFEQALRLEPDDAAAHFNLALALIRMKGRDAEARAQLEAFLRLRPGDARALRILSGLPPSQR